MTALNIQIPEQEFESLVELLKPEDKTIEKVADFILTINRNDDLEKIENGIKEISIHSKFIFSLIYTYSQTDLPAEQFINYVFDYYKAKAKEPAIKESFTHRLSLLIKEDSPIKLVVKTKVLKLANQRNFYKSRIFSDIRPVFLNNDEEEVIGMVILNQLKISYGELDKKKEFFVTLDSNDLNQLKQTIERAERKVKVLESKKIY